MNILVYCTRVFSKLYPFMSDLSDRGHKLAYYGDDPELILSLPRVKNITATKGRIADNMHTFDLFSTFQPELVFGFVVPVMGKVAFDAGAYQIFCHDLVGTATLSEMSWVMSSKLCLFNPIPEENTDKDLLELRRNNQAAKLGYLRQQEDVHGLQWQQKDFPTEPETRKLLLDEYKL